VKISISGGGGKHRNGGNLAAANRKSQSAYRRKRRRRKLGDNISISIETAKNKRNKRHGGVAIINNGESGAQWRMAKMAAAAPSSAHQRSKHHAKSISGMASWQASGGENINIAGSISNIVA